MARILTGVGLGWIVLPLLVVADAAARDRAGTESVVAVGVDVIVGGAVGVVIGASRVGWPGLLGVYGGATGGAALPYLAIPAHLGLSAPVLDRTRRRCSRRWLRSALGWQ